MTSPYSNDVYTVGWICALHFESLAGKIMLDEEHGKPQKQHCNDSNVYRLGRIDKHFIVMVGLPKGDYGTHSATTVTDHLLMSFEKIRFGLMVGIGGGIPNPRDDIRLGDIVVGVPSGPDNGGMVSYMRGNPKVDRYGFKQIKQLNRPPPILLSAVSSLQSDYAISRKLYNRTIKQCLKLNGERLGLSKKEIRLLSHPGLDQDRLFQADYIHQVRSSYKAATLETSPHNRRHTRHRIFSATSPGSYPTPHELKNVFGKQDQRSCEECDRSKQISRTPREDKNPRVHQGIIASGDILVRDSEERELIATAFGAICVEMEAAGLQNFPSLIIRGISDYADSHKNDNWQKYAALTASAYARELLYLIVGSNNFSEPLPSVFSHAQNSIQAPRRSETAPTPRALPFSLKIGTWSESGGLITVPVQVEGSKSGMQALRRAVTVPLCYEDSADSDRGSESYPVLPRLEFLDPLDLEFTDTISRDPDSPASTCTSSPVLDLSPPFECTGQSNSGSPKPLAFSIEETEFSALSLSPRSQASPTGRLSPSSIHEDVGVVWASTDEDEDSTHNNRDHGQGSEESVVSEDGQENIFESLRSAMQIVFYHGSRSSAQISRCTACFRQFTGVRFQCTNLDCKDVSICDACRQSIGRNTIDPASNSRVYEHTHAYIRISNSQYALPNERSQKQIPRCSFCGAGKVKGGDIRYRCKICSSLAACQACARSLHYACPAVEHHEFEAIASGSSILHNFYRLPTPTSLVQPRSILFLRSHTFTELWHLPACNSATTTASRLFLSFEDPTSHSTTFCELVGTVREIPSCKKLCIEETQASTWTEPSELLLEEQQQNMRELKGGRKPLQRHHQSSLSIFRLIDGTTQRLFRLNRNLYTPTKTHPFNGIWVGDPKDFPSLNQTENSSTAFYLFEHLDACGVQIYLLSTPPTSRKLVGSCPDLEPLIVVDTAPHPVSKFVGQALAASGSFQALLHKARGHGVAVTGSTHVEIRFLSESKVQLGGGYLFRYKPN